MTDDETTLHDDLRGWAPDGAVITGVIAVIHWLDPETGEATWRCATDHEGAVSEALGLLELAKLDIIARSDTGLPIKYEEDT